MKLRNSKEYPKLSLLKFQSPYKILHLDNMNKINNNRCISINIIIKIVVNRAKKYNNWLSFDIDEFLDKTDSFQLKYIDENISPLLIIIGTSKTKGTITKRGKRKILHEIDIININNNTKIINGLLRINLKLRFIFLENWVLIILLYIRISFFFFWN